jgi:AraC-like DNA-binding protein
VAGDVHCAHYPRFAIGTAVLRLRRATGTHWEPLGVDFQHRAPDDLSAYQKFFGPRLKFDRRENAIAVDATTLARPMPEILHGLFRSIQDLGERHLKEQVLPDDIATRAQRIIAVRLATEQPFDLEAIAAAMATQARALQWRLEQEATTYEKVLLLTRIIEAERYLRDSSHQLTKIASLLGFSELSAFTRWSQKQFAMSPSTYRAHLRGGGATSAAENPA